MCVVIHMHNKAETYIFEFSIFRQSENMKIEIYVLKKFFLVVRKVDISAQFALTG